MDNRGKVGTDSGVAGAAVAVVTALSPALRAVALYAPVAVLIPQLRAPPRVSWTARLPASARRVSVPGGWAGLRVRKARGEHGARAPDIARIHCKKYPLRWFFHSARISISYESVKLVGGI